MRQIVVALIFFVHVFPSFSIPIPTPQHGDQVTYGTGPGGGTRFQNTPKPDAFPLGAPGVMSGLELEPEDDGEGNDGLEDEPGITYQPYLILNRPQDKAGSMSPAPASADMDTNESSWAEGGETSRWNPKSLTAPGRQNSRESRGAQKQSSYVVEIEVEDDDAKGPQIRISPTQQEPETPNLPVVEEAPSKLEASSIPYTAESTLFQPGDTTVWTPTDTSGTRQDQSSLYKSSRPSMPGTSRQQPGGNLLTTPTLRGAASRVDTYRSPESVKSASIGQHMNPRPDIREQYDQVLKRTTGMSAKELGLYTLGKLNDPAKKFAYTNIRTKEQYQGQKN